MNENKTAIEEIIKLQFEHRDYRSAIFKKDGIPLMYEESIHIAIQAIDKQTAKKVKVDKYNGICGVPYKSCPTCDSLLWGSRLDREHKYCHECGQKLEWETKCDTEGGANEK